MLVLTQSYKIRRDCRALVHNPLHPLAAPAKISSPALKCEIEASNSSGYARMGLSLQGNFYKHHRTMHTHTDVHPRSTTPN